MISQPTLRPYQREAARAAWVAMRDHQRTLVVKPTGCGKTVTFSAIVREYVKRGRRCLIVAHREELVSQAVRKLRDFGLDADIEMADMAADQGVFSRADVVVASVQTLNSGPKCPQCKLRTRLQLQAWARDAQDAPCEAHAAIDVGCPACMRHAPGVPQGCDRCQDGINRRMVRFGASDFGLVVVDEAHHATARTYCRVLDYFSGADVLGVTATPDRADEESLGQIFETVAYEYDLPSAIDDGWLVPIRQQFVEVGELDLSRAKKNAGGDLQDKDVAEAMRILKAEGHLHKMVHPTIELAGDRPTLVFASSVAHASDMAAIFNRHRPGSAEILSGKTPKPTRQRTLKRFAAGEFQFLCNCALFLEGFDEPRIGCVSVCRPTASRALYAQIVGRGTRALPGLIDGLEHEEARRGAIAGSGKPDLLVLDYVGNSGRHKLVTTADLLGGRETEEVVTRANHLARENAAQGEPVDMTEALERARALIAAEEEERKRRAGVKASARFRTKTVDPFDILDMPKVREVPWHRGRQPTTRQKETLRKFGVSEDVIAESSFCQVQGMLDRLIKRSKEGLCTVKQAKILRKHGFGADCSFEEASATIDRIAKSGWTLRGP